VRLIVGLSARDRPAAFDPVVGLTSSYTGRGPTKAWTSIDGRSQLVLDMRKAYQTTMGRDLVR
jgi:hypothetical protein